MAQMAVTHLSGRFAFPLVVVVVVVLQLQTLWAVVVVVNCLLAALLMPQGVAERLAMATPYLAALAVAIALSQAPEVFMGAEVEVAGSLLVLLLQGGLVFTAAMAAQEGREVAALDKWVLPPAAVAAAAVAARVTAAMALPVESSSLFGKEYKNDIKLLRLLQHPDRVD
jgi:hypothetical protein